GDHRQGGLVLADRDQGRGLVGAVGEGDVGGGGLRGQSVGGGLQGGVDRRPAGERGWIRGLDRSRADGGRDRPVLGVLEDLGGGGPLIVQRHRVGGVRHGGAGLSCTGANQHQCSKQTGKRQAKRRA